MRFLLTKRAFKLFTPRFQRLCSTHSSFSSTSNSGDSEPESWKTMEGLLRSPANFTPLSPITFLERSAKVYRDRTSVVFGSVKHTWFQTYQRCLRLASALTKLGISPGDVVAALAPNVPAMHELHFAVPMAGLILCSLNTRLDPSTLSVLLAHSEAKILFVDHQLLEIAHGALDLLVKSDRTRKTPKLVLISQSNDDEDEDDSSSSKYSLDYDYETLLESGNSKFEVIKPKCEWDPISINYTSGTTSRPKGVVYSHRGAYLNSLATVFLHQMSVYPVYLWTVPMFHCNGWCLIWGVAAQGGTNICLRKVSPKLIFKNIAMHNVTHMGGAPTVLNMIVNSSETEHKPLPHRVEIMTGGSPPLPQILAKMEELGFNVSHLYGLTETYGPGTHCVWKPEWDSLSLEERTKLKARQGVQHLGLEGLEVKDPVTMKTVPNDGVTMGEVMFKGNTVMSGYFKDIEATRKAFEGDWFHSGDLAVKHPDGYIDIKDRLKDVIISGGENISTVEVERVLCSHEAVLEAAVVARPDNHWGQTPCGFVKLKDGFDGVKPEEIIKFCRDHLPHYMSPKTIVFGDLPKTSTGKVQKYLLKKPQQSRQPTKDANLYVNALIDPDSKRWKTNMLQDLFPAEDIQLILGIHPSLKFSRDSYCWAHTKSGQYTVRSGYEIAQAGSRGDCGLPFQGPSVTTLQAQSWKIQTSKKLQHFLWQIATGSLATCQRLSDRHLGTDRLCPRCGMADETVNHLFFECPPAFQVWSLPPSLVRSSFPSSSIFVNLDHLFWRAKELGEHISTIKIFPWILWYIWKARNAKVFENKDIHPSVSLQLATQEAEEFFLANARDKALEAQPDQIKDVRTALDQDVISCQLDGSWLNTDSLSGLGWIATSNQQIVQIGLKGTRRCLSPLHTEFEALLWAMSCLSSLSITNVVFETDCRDLTQLIEVPEDWPAFSSEFEDFRNLKLLFTSFRLLFIPRTNNVRADCLAKMARARGSLFSHVSYDIPNWFSPEESRILLA